MSSGALPLECPFGTVRRSATPPRSLHQEAPTARWPIITVPKLVSLGANRGAAPHRFPAARTSRQDVGTTLQLFDILQID